MSIPRAEYPNPQFERKNWINLNGEWDFEFDFGNSMLDAGILDKKEWSKKIIVPYCPESKLSGIGYTDFIPAVWYRRTFTVSKENLEGRVFIHFGAVDYKSTVYVNGKKVGVHKGGYSSFAYDITDFVVCGENTIVVNAYDNNRDYVQPKGKQAHVLHSSGCDYTRTTGIWQTVYLEFTPKEYIKKIKIFPDYENGSVTFTAELCGKGDFSAVALYEGKEMGKISKKADSFVSGEIKLDEIHLWEPGCGRLYDLNLKFGNDEVSSYFGLRNVSIDEYKFLINGKSVFQRLVLDQGFYPDGIYTAPTEEDLKKDIELSFAVGFNGARLHEKIFEPRFLYYADKLGYICWGEFPNWGLDYSKGEITDIMLPEWLEELERDFNHPSIVGWCPFNETWNQNGREQRNELLATIYKTTKAFDKTRPCIDTSGNYHVITDIYDVHDYEQRVDVFKEHYDKLMTDGEIYDHVNRDKDVYKGGIVFVSEYGGIRWSVTPDENGWGYGNAPKTEEEFIERYKGLTDALLDNNRMFGFCYTQLYDIEQEQNGLYTYERASKFDPEIFKKINSRKAAIED